MMNYTQKLGLKLPESTDRFDIGDFNENAETLDNALVSGDNGFDTDGEPVYIIKDTDSSHFYTAGMSSEGEGELELTVGVRRGARYDPYKEVVTRYSYDEEEAATVAETAADIVRFRVGESVLEVREEGVTFNGRSLGGGSQPIGQALGLLAGITGSVTGTLEEVEE